MDDFLIKVPATSANLGPGFDLFGLALNQYAWFRCSLHNSPDSWKVFNENGRDLGLQADQNLFRTGFLAAMEKAGIPENHYRFMSVSAKFRMDLPVGSGFGSSACALTAGVMAAAHFTRTTTEMPALSLQQELDLLTELEGHPDNAVPARIGGFAFSVYNEGQKPVILSKKLPEDLGLAVVIPAFQVSTAQSRKELPASYPMSDVLANIKGSLLWLEYLHTGNSDYLIRATSSDQLHEKYRGRHIPLYPPLKSSIQEADCLGITVSGSGPGLLIYYAKAAETTAVKGVQSLIRKISEQTGTDASPVRVCEPDYQGAVLTADASEFPF